MSTSQAIALARLVTSDPGVLVSLVRWPVFSVTSYKLVRTLREAGLRPQCVIDVGANIGQFSVAMLELFPGIRLVSFEPSPDAHKTLKGNLSGYASAMAIDCALAEREGEVELHLNSHSQSSSLLRLTSRHFNAFPDAQEVGRVRVRLSTLDVELKSVALPRPTLLKIDVQGSEASVLRGAQRKLEEVDHVLCEASFKQLYKDETLFMDLVSMLDGFGFRFVQPVGHLADPKTGELLQIDALFERKDRSSQIAA